MKKSKVRTYFGMGRKIAFSLVLFLLVFAAASIIKIHASSTDNVTGWLWGGSDDGAGNNTGVGWISMNDTNPGAGGSVSYGVNIPSSNGAVSGYAWSEWIGWVQFDVAGDNTTYPGCGFPSVPCNSAKRNGDKLEGWARVLSLPQAGTNAGGWEGWIKLASNSGDPISYGVKINADGTFVKCTSGGDGCAWSAETKIGGVPQGFGWIDFSRAKIVKVPWISAGSTTLSKFDSCKPISATLTDNSGGETVKFANNNATKDVKLATDSSCSTSADSATCSVASAGGSCSVYATTSNFSSGYSQVLDVTCPTCTSTTTTVYVKEAKNCTISCPSSVTIAAGDTGSINCSVTGGSGCVIDTCTKTSDSAGIISSGSPSPVGGKCQVTIKTGASFQDQATVTSQISGDGSADTTIFVKRIGWVETNP